MLIRTIAAVSALALVAATPAIAQSATASVLTVSQVEQRLSGQGYRVIEVERDDGEFEVKAFNAQGQCRELHLNLRTGEVIREESDDDCNNDGRGRRGGRR